MRLIHAITIGLLLTASSIFSPSLAQQSSCGNYWVNPETGQRECFDFNSGGRNTTGTSTGSTTPTGVAALIFGKSPEEVISIFGNPVDTGRRSLTYLPGQIPLSGNKFQNLRYVQFRFTNDQLTSIHLRYPNNGFTANSNFQNYQETASLFFGQFFGESASVSFLSRDGYLRTYCLGGGVSASVAAVPRTLVSNQRVMVANSMSVNANSRCQ